MIMGRFNMTKRRQNPKTFSKVLNNLLEEKGLGVREAARIANVGASTIMSWKSGSNPENYEAAKRLAKGLGVSLAFLLTGEDDSRSDSTAPSIAEVFEDGGELFDG